MIMMIRIRFTQDLTKNNKYYMCKICSYYMPKEKIAKSYQAPPIPTYWMEMYIKLAFIKNGIIDHSVLAKKMLIQFWP